MSFKERGQREEHGWVGTNNTLDLPMNLKEMICSVTSQGGEKYGQTGAGGSGHSRQQTRTPDQPQKVIISFIKGTTDLN